VGVDTIHDRFFLAIGRAGTRDIQDVRGKKRASGREVRRPFSAATTTERASLDAQKLLKYADALRLDRVEMVHQWHKGKPAPTLREADRLDQDRPDFAGQVRDFLREDASTSLGLWRR
jgi:hypothetical protein